MSHTPRFSFVMPAYKAQYLREAIDSILRQTYADLELIVVDDHSPEDLRSITDGFHDNRLAYRRNAENIGGKGLVAQWEYCLSLARGEFLILATDDDRYHPDFLAQIAPLTEKYPETVVFRARIMSINREGEILWTDRCYKEFLTQEEFYYHYLHGMMGGIPQFVFRRKEFVAGGGFVPFPLAWGSDDATALLHARHGLVNTQDMLVDFRWSDINISSRHDTTTVRKKVEARVALCRWLLRKVAGLTFSDTPIGRHCRDYVAGGIGVHIKMILLKELLPLSLADFLRMLRYVSSRHILPHRDLCSILCRYIKG